jgi:hypothetical protein
MAVDSSLYIYLPSRAPGTTYNPHAALPHTGSIMSNFLVRGILIGGALGAFGGMLGLSDNLPRAVAIGMVGGFFAGLTLARKHAKKQNNTK